MDDSHEGVRLHQESTSVLVPCVMVFSLLSSSSLRYSSSREGRYYRQHHRSHHRGHFTLGHHRNSHRHVPQTPQQQAQRRVSNCVTECVCVCVSSLNPHVCSVRYLRIGPLDEMPCVSLNVITVFVFQWSTQVQAPPAPEDKRLHEHGESDRNNRKR